MITAPDAQKRKEAITQAIVSQLRSFFQTGEGGTLTGVSLQSQIASSLPADDCWTEIPEIHLHAKLVSPGQEGAIILIERIELDSVNRPPQTP